MRYDPVFFYVFGDLRARVVRVVRGGCLFGGDVVNEELHDQTVVVIGGSVGIGFEMVWWVRVEGVQVIVIGCNLECFERVVDEFGVLSSVAFDVVDLDWLVRFFVELLGLVDYVFVIVGCLYYVLFVEFDFE